MLHWMTRGRVMFLSRSRPSTDTQNQQQTNPTTLSSHSSPTAGRETLDQQRRFEARTFIAGTTAYTQYGVAETFGAPHQRPSANNASGYSTTIDDHDLQGEDSQTAGAASTQHEPRVARTGEALACPYNRSILQGGSTTVRSGQGLGPMERYLAEGPSARYAIHRRPDAASVSTHNGCRCLEMMQSSTDANGHARK